MARARARAPPTTDARGRTMRQSYGSSSRAEELGDDTLVKS